MIASIQERPQSKSQKHIPWQLPSRNVNKEQAQKSYQMAREHQSRKEYRKAIKHYAQAVMHNPMLYQAYCNVGIVYRNQQKYVDAISSYLSALSIQRDDFKAMYNLANVYRIMGNPDEAIKCYEEVIKLSQNRDLELSSYNNLGVCYKNISQYEEAIRCYEKVIEFDPKFEGGYYNKALCVIYLMRAMNKDFKETYAKRADEAQRLLRILLKDCNPNNIMAKVYLAELRHQRANNHDVVQESLDELKGILEKEKGKMSDAMEEEINRKIAFCLATLKRFEESARHYREGLRQATPHNSSRITSSINIPVNEYDPQDKEQQQRQLSSAERQQLQGQQNLKEVMVKVDQLVDENEFDAALSELKEAPACAGRNQQLILLLAKYAQASGQQKYAYQAAETYKFTFLMKANLGKTASHTAFREPLLSDVSIETHKALAECYQIIDQHKNAIKHYSFVGEWCEQHHTTDETYVQNQSALSQNYESLGLFQDSIDCYKKVLQLDPESFDLNYNLANCYQQGSLANEAVKAYQRCLSILQQSAADEDWFKKGDCLLNLSICHGLLLHPNQQLEEMEKAIKIIDQHCDSLEKMLQNYDEKFLMDIYLQLANLYEHVLQEEAESMAKEKVEKTREKLLSAYLLLLEFKQCPDREEIILNCGNTLYQQKMYLNALEYYHQLPSKQSSNYLGLTYLRVNEFIPAYTWLENTIRQNPDNQICSINISLANWLFCETKSQHQKITAFSDLLPCKCDRFFQYRLLFTMQFIDCLTETLSETGKDLNTPLSSINQVVYQIIEKLRQSSELQSNSDKALVSRRKFMFQRLDQHAAGHDKIADRAQQEVISKDDIILALTPIGSDKIKEAFTALIDKLKAIRDSQGTEYWCYPSIVQNILSMFLLTNSNYQQDIEALLKASISQESTPNLGSLLDKGLRDQIALLAPLKQGFLPDLRLEQPVLLDDFIDDLQEWEIKVEAKYFPLLEKLKELYWTQDTDPKFSGIAETMRIEWNIPKCTQILECDECAIKAAAMLATTFGKQDLYADNLQKSSRGSLRLRVLGAIRDTYSMNELENTQQLVVLESGTDFYPLTVHLYHSNKKETEIFIRRCLSTENQANQELPLHLKLVENGGSVGMVMNSILKVEFHIGARDFISEYAKKAFEFPLGNQVITTMTLESSQLSSFPGCNNQQWTQSYLSWKQNKLLTKDD